VGTGSRQETRQIKNPDAFPRFFDEIASDAAAQRKLPRISPRAWFRHEGGGRLFRQAPRGRSLAVDRASSAAAVAPRHRRLGPRHADRAGASADSGGRGRSVRRRPRRSGRCLLRELNHRAHCRDPKIRSARQRTKRRLIHAADAMATIGASCHRRVRDRGCIHYHGAFAAWVPRDAGVSAHAERFAVGAQALDRIAGLIIGIARSSGSTAVSTVAAGRRRAQPEVAGAAAATEPRGNSQAATGDASIP